MDINSIISPTITKIEELEGKTKYEIWNIFQHLKNQNIILLGYISNLQINLHEKEQELSILKQELSDIIILKTEVKRLLEDNKKLEIIIKQQNEKIEEQNEKINKMGIEIEKLKQIREPIAVRFYGSVLETKIRILIFPNCGKKEFGIDSLKQLFDFIKNPTKATQDYDLFEADKEWLKLPEIERNEIQQRMNNLLKLFPRIIQNIQRLKKYGNSVAHSNHNLTTKQCIEYLKQNCGDELIIDALEEYNNIIDNETINETICKEILKN